MLHTQVHGMEDSRSRFWRNSRYQQSSKPVPQHHLNINLRVDLHYGIALAPTALRWYLGRIWLHPIIEEDPALEDYHHGGCLACVNRRNSRIQIHLEACVE